MRPSNKLLLILAAVTALGSGCTLKTEQSPLADNATFRVDSTGGSVVNESIIAGWDIPYERRFNLSACLKSLSGREDIVNHAFEISGDERAYTRSTDSHGCVNWTEIVGFDYLAQPTFINLKRQIKSLGKQRGTVEFTVAINAWSGLLGSEPPVVDLKRGTVTRIMDSDAGLTALRARSRESAVELEIETLDYRLQLNNPSRTQDAVLHLEFKPSLILKDMSGKTVRQSLERGKFKVTAYLLRLDEGDRKTLVHKMITPVDVALKNGNAIFDTPLKFENVKLDAQKAYALALHVTADGGPAFIADYSRVYDIPTFASLQGGTLSLTSQSKAEAGEFDFQTYLRGVRGLTEPTVSEAGGGFFTIGRINGGNNGIIDESMMQRRVKLSLSTDVRWASNLSPLQGRKFKIYSMQTGAGGQRRVITPKGATDPDGMLYWEDEVVHSMYRKQERMKFDITIEDELTGRKVTQCIVTNPWDFWATFFRDCNELNEPSTVVTQPLISSVPKVPLLKIDGLCMARTDSQISDSAILDMIQPDLSLMTKHRYNLQLSAMVLRYDDLRTGLQTPGEAMRGGWWLLSIAVYKNSPASGSVGTAGANGELEPVYTMEKAICNPGTSPAAEIEVALKELGLMDRNNYIAIQIKPLDQKKLKFTDAVGEPTGAYCSGVQVAKDSELAVDTDNDLVSPPYIFPMNLRAGGCPIVISHGNFEDVRLKKLQAQLNRKDVHQVHIEAQRKKDQETLAETARLQQERVNGWKKYGESLGLRPHLLRDVKDIEQALPNAGLGDPSKLFATLQCLDQNFWADRVHQAQCTLNPEVLAIAQVLCEQTSSLNGDNTDCTNPLKDFLVEEKVHVYGISDANYGGGFSTSLSVSNSFALGTFNGSDFGHALSDSLAVGAAVSGGVSKGPVSGGLEASGSKSWSAFNINFTREWIDNQVGVGASATLTVENADINIKLSEYRRCYVLSTRTTRDKGFYLCTNVVTEPEWRQERYFVIFNPGFSGSILNSNDERNRWLMQFRGERFYYHLMATLNNNFAPFNIDGVSVMMTDILKRTYSLYADRTGWGDPYVISSLAPGVDAFRRVEGSIRNLPILGFNPFEDFNNQAFRDQNDPNLRVHDHDSNFQD